MRRTFVGKWVLALLLVVILIATAKQLPLSEWLKRLRAPILQAGAWGPVFYGLIYVVATLLFLPGSVLTLGAGGLFGWRLGVPLVSIASTVSAGIAFLVARYAASRQVRMTIEKSPKLLAIDRAFTDDGWKLVALLRLSPAVPFVLLNYLCGVTSLQFGSYLLASWLAMIPGSFLYVYLGALGAEAVQPQQASVALWIARGVGLAATIAVTVILTRTATKAVRQRLGESDEGRGGMQLGGSDRPA